MDPIEIVARVVAAALLIYGSGVLIIEVLDN
jgi:hypothetical protein